MKKIFSIILFLNILVVFTYTSEENYNLIKVLILEKYINSDFKKTLLFGTLNEDGLEILPGLLIFSDDLNIFYYNDQPYTGRVYNIYLEAEMKDGKLDGDAIMTFFDGRKITRTYKNGVLKSAEKIKKLNGKVSDNKIILENDSDCISYSYPEYIYRLNYENVTGNIIAEQCSFSIKNGKLDGKYIGKYRSSNMKKFELNFQNGNLEGRVINWDKDENIIYRSYIKNGTGEMKIIDEGIIFTYNYKNNKKHGLVSVNFINYPKMKKIEEYYFYGIKLHEKKDFEHLNELEKNKNIEKIPDYIKQMKEGN